MSLSDKLSRAMSDLRKAQSAGRHGEVADLADYISMLRDADRYKNRRRARSEMQTLDAASRGDSEKC